MSQSVDERSDAGSNTEPRGETIIDFDGNVRQTQPQTYEQRDSESEEKQAASFQSNTLVKYVIYKAANKGDWLTAKRMYEKYKLPFNAPITANRQTALHIAALAGQTQFAKELIHKMRNDDELRQQDEDGKTPLVYAMVSGDMALVEAMVQKCKVARLSSKELLDHILASTGLGSKDLVPYMYKVCKDLIKNDDRGDLLVDLINADEYDTALDLAEEGWFTACTKAYKVDALSALAEKPIVDVTFRQALSYFYGYGGPLKNNISKRDLADKISGQVASDDNAILDMKKGHWRPIFVAAEHGNVEFLVMLIKNLPDAVFQRNDEGQTIFHVAVLFRRAEVFDLLSEICSFKYLISKYRDKNGNTLLHMAGELSPSDYLDALPGEALQLQRELLWFERVKKFVGPVQAEAKNKYGDSPANVFMKTHKDLIKKGEEWLKKTADSCTIVAALVATVVFAALFTAPGGNNQNTGFPMFLNEASFKTYIVSDSISLICALSSLLTFMSIQTSTYSLKHFVWLLPTKLLIGYLTLFVSIAAMMVTFVTVLFVYFRQHQLLSVALPLALVAVFPVGLFAVLHYRLFSGMIMFWQALQKIRH